MQLLHANKECFTNLELFRQKHLQKERARPGFEPGTSRTLSGNHTPRPTGHLNEIVFL